MSREDQHGDMRAAIAQPAQHGDAVELGQREIEDDKVVRRGTERLVGRLAVGDGVDGIRRLVQRADDRRRQHGVVLHDQDFHGGASRANAGQRRWTISRVAAYA